MAIARKSTKVVAPVVATKKTPAPAPIETVYDVQKKKKEEERLAVEAYLAKANAVLDTKTNTKKETTMPKTTKKAETAAVETKAVATKKTAVKAPVKKANTKKEVALVKKTTKKAEVKKPAVATKKVAVKATTTNKKEKAMKKGTKKVEAPKHNFIRSEVTVRESLAKYNNKVELDPKTDKVYLIDKASVTVLKRKLTTDTHNLTVFIRKNAGKNAKALEEFEIRATAKDKAIVEKFRAQYKGKAIVVEVLSDRPYVYVAKEVHVCVRYIKLSK